MSTQILVVGRIFFDMFFPLNLRVPTSRASIQESKLEVTLYAIKFDVSAEFVNVVFLSDCLGLVKGFHDQYSYIHYSILSVLDTTKVLCTKYNYTIFWESRYGNVPTHRLAQASNSERILS